MTLFLTSSACLYRNGPLNPANGFIERLLKEINNKTVNVCWIPSNPCDQEMNDIYSQSVHHALDEAGIRIHQYTVLKEDASIIKDYDILVLSGGHVPTQNAYFHDIKLKDYLKEYKGILITISAGSMNCATDVYSQPELEGETNPNYQKWLKGLGLIDINILPHYQDVKDTILDGYKVFEDISYQDSITYNKEFYCFVDGTYLLLKNNQATIYGECFLIKNGKLTKILEENQMMAYNILTK